VIYFMASDDGKFFCGAKCPYWPQADVPNYQTNV
jgi:hypothetical protein